ncbi:L domain-like protein [Cylindrobasidium torrendii FP15055 ss-10]|uniref:L domain-like protein n=1 Tax=Cylindrobasidium torrendii FP15055 ss-10 TaxID=1314674 RepID=A0A0D7BNJ4_9AGAR|nr:L domain-like protein [Cylindrobasidium torrendii FP15055 ss-10]
MAARAPGWQTEELADEWPSFAESVEMSIDPTQGNGLISHSNSQASESQYYPPPSPSASSSAGSGTPTEEDSGIEWPTAEADEHDGHMSFTAPHGTFVDRGGTFVDHDARPAGTFVDRGSEQGVARGVGRTPGKGMLQRDFFTPLKLERMFEPPSPPPEQAAGDHGDTDLAQDRLLKPLPPHARPMHSPPSGVFTFRCQGESTPANLATTSTSPTPIFAPEALAPGDGIYPTPLPSKSLVGTPRSAPFTPLRANNKHLAHARSGGGTPLKLFQFSYDTYTREHLSAMVDEIGVGGSSGGPSPIEGPAKRALGRPARPRQPQRRRSSSASSVASDDILRSAKRLKVSPPSPGPVERADVESAEEGEEIYIARPRQWIGEGRRMMESLKRADLSSMSSRRSTLGAESILSGALPSRSRNSDDSEHGPEQYLNRRNEGLSMMDAIRMQEDAESVFQDEDQSEDDDDEEATQRPTAPSTPTQPPPPHRPAQATIRTAPSSTAANSPGRLFSGSSATTQTSATTQNTVQPSVGSYVKHAGPPVTIMRTIRPNDDDVARIVSAAGQAGGMVFDPTQGRWIREIEGETSNDSISGFTESDSGESQEPQDREDEEVVERDDLSTVPEEPSALAASTVAISDEGSAFQSETGPSQTEDSRATSSRASSSQEAPDFDSPPNSPVLEDTPPEPAPPISIPQSISTASSLDTQKTPTRSVLKTPANSTRHRKRRSVSFSDGRRDGPIMDLDSESEGEEGENPTTQGHETGAGGPSARSRRLEDLFRNAEEDESLGFGANFGVSIGKQDISSASQRPTSGMSAAPSFLLSHDALLGALTDVEPFTTYWDRLVSVDLAWPFTRRTERADASMTDASMCSTTVGTVSNRPPLASMARLDEFVPRLLKLDLSRNPVEYLTGVPSGLRELSARETMLGSVEGLGEGGWAKLVKLERLDLTGGRVQRCEQFSGLRTLTHLDLAGNRLTSLRGIEGLRHLVYLDVSENRGLRELDFGNVSWRGMQEFKAARCRVGAVHGLGRILSTGILRLDLEDNELTELDIELPTPTPTRKRTRDNTTSSLRVLRVSGNRLRKLHLGALPALRTLYADRNHLREVILSTSGKMEIISLRYQEGSSKANGLRLPVCAREVKRVYLSGTVGCAMPWAWGNGTVKCYNLTYLELAGCGLKDSSLLEGLSTHVPNLRTLNVNYNHFEGGLGFLRGLERLRRVSAVGCGVKRVRGIVDVFKVDHGPSMFPELQVLDVRGNPSVAGWYLPVSVQDATKQSAQSTNSYGTYTELDVPYRRSLPDRTYAGRLAYRGLVMQGCPALRVLDGVVVTTKERDKAAEFVARLVKTKQTADVLL